MIMIIVIIIVTMIMILFQLRFCMLNMFSCAE